MEPAEREIYNGALAYEASVGSDAASAKPFRGIGQAEKDKYIAIAKAVLAGVSGADANTNRTAAPNAFALPTVDPVTGERLQSAHDVNGGLDSGLADRAGLGSVAGGSGSGTDTSLPKASSKK